MIFSSSSFYYSCTYSRLTVKSTKKTLMESLTWELGVVTDNQDIVLVRNDTIVVVLLFLLLLFVTMGPLYCFCLS